jgi:hypothetical protein
MKGENISRRKPHSDKVCSWNPFVVHNELQEVKGANTLEAPRYLDESDSYVPGV